MREKTSLFMLLFSWRGIKRLTSHLWWRYVRRQPGRCIDGECFLCGERDCPHGEFLHYHHDGCPACWRDECLKEDIRQFRLKAFEALVDGDPPWAQPEDVELPTVEERKEEMDKTVVVKYVGQETWGWVWACQCPCGHEWDEVGNYRFDLDITKIQCEKCKNVVTNPDMSDDI